MITADQLGEVYEKLNKGNDSVVRYVLDIKASNWWDKQNSWYQGRCQEIISCSGSSCKM
jgi:hypothetical protein